MNSYNHTISPGRPCRSRKRSPEEFCVDEITDPSLRPAHAGLFAFHGKRTDRPGLREAHETIETSAPCSRTATGTLVPRSRQTAAAPAGKPAYCFRQFRRSINRSSRPNESNLAPDGNRPSLAIDRHVGKNAVRDAQLLAVHVALHPDLDRNHHRSAPDFF